MEEGGRETQPIDQVGIAIRPRCEHVAGLKAVGIGTPSLVEVAAAEEAAPIPGVPLPLVP